ncbi:hypothetical protein D3C73_1664060 [compost metagenome]
MIGKFLAWYLKSALPLAKLMVANSVSALSPQRNDTAGTPLVVVTAPMYFMGPWLTWNM